MYLNNINLIGFNLNYKYFIKDFSILIEKYFYDNEYILMIIYVIQSLKSFRISASVNCAGDIILDLSYFINTSEISSRITS